MNGNLNVGWMSIVGLIAAAILLTTSAHAQTEVGGPILGNTIWTAAGSPYIVTNAIIIGGSATLTIEPGVTVRFNAGLGITVGSAAFGPGTLKAVGTAEQKITFTSNIDPDQITHVIVTHLHFDHAGGLTTHDPKGQPIPVFPNAPVFVQRTEWEDALANKSTMTRTYLRDHLDPIADRVQLIDGEAEILPGISVVPVPGHTWGMQAVMFNDERGTLCFPGDVIPTINHVGLAFSLGYDMMPYQNMLTKVDLLERAAAGGWRLVLDHEPGQAVVSVGPRGSNPDKPGQFILRPA